MSQTMQRRTGRIPFVAAIVLVLAGLALAAGPVPEATAATAQPRPFEIHAPLYPKFRANRGSYVAKCERRMAVTVPRGLLVHVGGERFEVVARGRPHRVFRFSAPVRLGADFTITTRPAPRPRGPRGGQRGEVNRYRIRCLPRYFPGWEFSRLRGVSPGLFSITTFTLRPWIIIFDSRGRPRWWYQPRYKALGAQVLRNGNVEYSRAFGDGYGRDPRMLHEIRRLNGRLVATLQTRGSLIDPHENEPARNGTHFVASYRQRGPVDLSPYCSKSGTCGPTDGYVVDAEVQQLDLKRRVLWRWNSSQIGADGEAHIPLRYTPKAWWQKILLISKIFQGHRTYDVLHINSIEAYGRQIIITTRHTDAVYGISRRTGEVLWKLGGLRAPESLQVVGDPHVRYPLSGPHDARVVGPGPTISVYDNATLLKRRPRLVIYKLNLRRDRAVYVDQMSDPMVEGSHCCGSARRYGRGWIVSWGGNELVSGFDPRGRVAFRLQIPWPTLRAVPVPKGAVTLAELEAGLEAMEGRRLGRRKMPGPRPLEG